MGGDKHGQSSWLEVTGNSTRAIIRQYVMLCYPAAKFINSSFSPAIGVKVIAFPSVYGEKGPLRDSAQGRHLWGPNAACSDGSAAGNVLFWGRSTRAGTGVEVSVCACVRGIHSHSADASEIEDKN